MLFQTLFADLIKAGGHKYIRRIPTGNPKRPWQYIYTESAAARGATEGEDVKVRGKGGEDTYARVHKVDEGGVEIEVDGERRRVTHADWHKLLAEVHGERYLQWADKRARQVANALYRTVPRNLLAELPDKEPARTDALKERSPEVYAKLQAAFKRAGMSPFDAQQALQFTLSQRGWDADARATLIGNMLDGKRRWLAKSYRQVAAAAANLASAHGSRKVQAKHVQAALDLRQPRPQDGERFDKTLQVEQTQAQAELGKLQKLLEAARGGSPQDAAAALQAALASPMMTKLAELALAFPGLRNDETVTQSRDALAEVAAARPGNPRRDGAETHVFVAGEDGRAVPLPGRYKLVEAEDLIASHKPGTFARNEAYPEGLQERAYHRDKAEQGKVIRNADRIEPSIVVNTNPDAVNGPPVIDSKGIVLGGNSRSMSMILAYEKGKDSADKLRSYLAEHAYEVGLRPEDVQAMRNPVLVREVDTTGQDPKLLVRQLNESFTQAMDPRTMQVAVARKLPEETLAQLGSLMGEDETLNAFLGSTRARTLVSQLRTAGIIDRRNENQYTQKGRSDALNEDGKQLVERVLLGKMVDDPDILSDTPASLVSSVARAVPYMVQAESAGEGYAVRKDLRTALQAYNSMRRIEGAIPDKASMDRGGDFLQRKIDQGIDSLTDMFEGEHPIAASPRARAILDVLIRKSGPVQMAKIFRAYARQAKANPEGQASLFGAPKAPADVFRDAVNADEPKAEEPEKEQGGLFRSLFGDLIKSRGHKYIRREPTGNPKAPWRYIYRDAQGREYSSGNAPGARARQTSMELGDEFRLRAPKAKAQRKQQRPQGTQGSLFGGGGGSGEKPPAPPTNPFEGKTYRRTVDPDRARRTSKPNFDGQLVETRDGPGIVINTQATWYSDDGLSFGLSADSGWDVSYEVRPLNDRELAEHTKRKKAEADEKARAQALKDEIAGGVAAGTQIDTTRQSLDALDPGLKVEDLDTGEGVQYQRLTFSDGSIGYARHGGGGPYIAYLPPTMVDAAFEQQRKIQPDYTADDAAANIASGYGTPYARWLVAKDKGGEYLDKIEAALAARRAKLDTLKEAAPSVSFSGREFSVEAEGGIKSIRVSPSMDDPLSLEVRTPEGKVITPQTLKDLAADALPPAPEQRESPDKLPSTEAAKKAEPRKLEHRKASSARARGLRAPDQPTVDFGADKVQIGDVVRVSGPSGKPLDAVITSYSPTYDRGSRRYTVMPVEQYLDPADTRKAEQEQIAAAAAERKAREEQAQKDREERAAAQGRMRSLSRPTSSQPSRQPTPRPAGATPPGRRVPMQTLLAGAGRVWYASKAATPHYRVYFGQGQYDYHSVEVGAGGVAKIRPGRGGAAVLNKIRSALEGGGYDVQDVRKGLFGTLADVASRRATVLSPTGRPRSGR